MSVSRLALPILAAAVLLAAPPADAQVTISGTIQYWDPIGGVYQVARRVDVRVKGNWWFADPRTETDDQGRYSVQVNDPKGLKKQFDNVRVHAFAQTRGIVQVFPFMLAPKPYSAVSRELDGVRAGQSWTRDLRIGGPANDALLPPSPSLVPLVSIDAVAAAFVVHREMQEHHRDLRARAFTADDFDERGGDRVGGVEVIVPAWGPPTSYYNTATGFVNLVPIDRLWPNVEDVDPHPFLDPAVSMFLATIRHEYSHAIHDEMTGGGILTGLTIPSIHGPDRESPYRALAYTEGFAEFLPLVSLGQGGSYEPTLETDPSPGGLPIPVASPPGTHHQWEGEFAAFLWDLFDPTGIESIRHRTATAENDGSTLPTDVVDAQVWTDAIEDPDVSRIRRAVREPLPVVGHVPQRVSEYLINYTHLYGSRDPYPIKVIAFNRDLLIPGMEVVEWDGGTPGASSVGDPVTSGLPERPARLEGMEMEHLRWLSYRFDVVEPDSEDRTSVRVTVWFQTAPDTVRQILDRELATGWNDDRLEVVTRFDAAGRGGNGERLWVLVNDGMLPTAYGFDVPPVDEETLADLLQGVVPDPPTRFQPGAVPGQEGPAVGPEDIERPVASPTQDVRAFRLWNLRTGPVCRDPKLVAERREEARPPSDRICASRDVFIRGEDICNWSGERRPCTWFGFEFDYENADPSVPLVCAWTRSRPADEGNYEGVRRRDATSGTSEIRFDAEDGHVFSPGYELPIPVPWLGVDVHFDCTYRGQPAFEVDYRVIQSKALRR